MVVFRPVHAITDGSDRSRPGLCPFVSGRGCYAGNPPPPPQNTPLPAIHLSPPRPPAPSKHILPRPPLHPLTGVFAADGGDEAEENELEDGQGSGGFAEAAVIALLGDE